MKCRGREYRDTVGDVSNFQISFSPSLDMKKTAINNYSYKVG